jgi:hypothetical protein
LERAVEDACDAEFALCELGGFGHPVKSDGKAGGGDAEDRKCEDDLKEEKSAFRGMWVADGH